MQIRALTLAATLAASILTAAMPAMADESTSTPSETTATACFQRSADNLKAYNRMAKQLIKKGLLTREEANAIRCDPALTMPTTSYGDSDVSPEPSPSTTPGSAADDPWTPESVTNDPRYADIEAFQLVNPLTTVTPQAVSCGDGYYLGQSMMHYVDMGGWPKSATSTFSLKWCWNKRTKKVRDASGTCSGSVTKWGWINGWSFEGCTTNEYISYALGGSYPGGVHHYGVAHFTENFLIRTVNVDSKMQIWGHYDGSCDSKFGRTLRHYC